MFTILYRNGNNKNKISKENLIIDSLEDAVDSFDPDMDIEKRIGKCRTKIQTPSDMFGLHEDFLALVESIEFHKPISGPYIIDYFRNQNKSIYFLNRIAEC
ncbi:MAG: hypothetical protein OEZ34_02760 [Spirochaetia bacterium]|nr:hypothetical protein [Spirochaetia bacterium]